MAEIGRAVFLSWCTPQWRGLLLGLSRVAEYRPFLPLAGFFTGQLGRFLNQR